MATVAPEQLRNASNLRYLLQKKRRAMLRFWFLLPLWVLSVLWCLLLTAVAYFTWSEGPFYDKDFVEQPFPVTWLDAAKALGAFVR